MYSGCLCKTGSGICSGKTSDLYSDSVFRNGYNTTAVKVFETKDAIANGASEIDMVINIGFLKDGRYEEVENEIRAIHEACDGRILKVIIETCLLTEEEKIKMCETLQMPEQNLSKLLPDFPQREQLLQM